MKILGILAILFTIVMVPVLSIIGYFLISRPTIDGTVYVSSINGNGTIEFDEYGVPHITGSNERSLYHAIGKSILLLHFVY
jgi:acyl-homoserine lactone acylase PvdQ